VDENGIKLKDLADLPGDATAIVSEISDRGSGVRLKFCDRVGLLLASDEMSLECWTHVRRLPMPTSPRYLDALDGAAEEVWTKEDDASGERGLDRQTSTWYKQSATTYPNGANAMQHVIYRPSGKALEYADFAANLYTGMQPRLANTATPPIACIPDRAKVSLNRQLSGPAR